MEIQLVGIEGPMRGKARDLASGTYTIGRDASCDVQIIDDANASRSHAILRIVNGKAEVEDANSKNGTWVNDKRVLVEDIRDGDRLRIGDCVFLVKRIVERETGNVLVGYPPPTPEVRYAGFWVRLAARLVDLLAIGLPLGLVNYLVSILMPWENMSPAWLKFTIAIGSIINVVIFAGYFVWMDGSSGQTLGRMATSTKVIRSDGGLMDHNLALQRHLLHAAITLVAPLIIAGIAFRLVIVAGGLKGLFGLATGTQMILGLLAAMVVTFEIYYYILLSADRKKRGWHDTASDSIVVVSPTHD